MDLEKNHSTAHALMQLYDNTSNALDNSLVSCSYGKSRFFNCTLFFVIVFSLLLIYLLVIVSYFFIL